jgi:hypothetical protein
MRAHLAPGCRILLDDVAREDEQRILNQWSAELKAKYSILGAAKPFAELTVPEVA